MCKTCWWKDASSINQGRCEHGEPESEWEANGIWLMSSTRGLALRSLMEFNDRKWLQTPVDMNTLHRANYKEQHLTRFPEIHSQPWSVMSRSVSLTPPSTLVMNQDFDGRAIHIYFSIKKRTAANLPHWAWWNDGRIVFRFPLPGWETALSSFSSWAPGDIR